MSSLKHIDRIKLEKFFGMGSGYVCDFTDRTFGDFVMESTGIDAYAPGYDSGGTSKANRLRTFWKRESDAITATLISDLLDYWQDRRTPEGYAHADQAKLLQDCRKILEKLKTATIDDVGAFAVSSPDKSFNLLARSIRESIDKGEPEQALDRLHTFIVKRVRELCTTHLVPFDKDTALHTLFGGYVKSLRQQGHIESEMADRILKSSISVLESFNDVRNNKSLAHDNAVLNRPESILIFNNISNTLRFIESIEDKIHEKMNKGRGNVAWDDIPYTAEEIEAAGDAYIQMQKDIQRSK